MSDTNKIKTCPVENCRAKGGPANCRYHAGVLLHYAARVRTVPPCLREGSSELAEWQDYSEKMVKWYKNNKKRADKKDEPAYDEGTPIASDEDVKTLYDAISQSINNPVLYMKLTGATRVIPSNAISSALQEQLGDLQLDEVSFGLDSGVDVSIYADPKYDAGQMNAIRRGLEAGIDVSLYADPKYDEWQMWQIRWGIENGVDVSVYADPEKFDGEQMEQIRLGLEEGIDISVYADTEFGGDQMDEIRLGLIDGIDVSKYADPEIDWEQMCEIRGSLKD